VVTARLKQVGTGVEVLILTMNDDSDMVERCLAAGARGYLLKTDAEEHLISAIAAVAAGQTYFSPFISDQLARIERAGQGSLRR
jgi:DNA-binding NarL/FixJ family response regulator